MTTVIESNENQPRFVVMSMMPSIKSPLVVSAFGCSLLASSPSVAALQLNPPTAYDRNHVASFAARHQFASYRSAISNDAIRRHVTRLYSRENDDDEEEDDGPSKSNKKGENNKNSDNDDNDEDEEIMNMNDWIDFDGMDKSFNDIPDYGVIRSLESPNDNYNPIDPVSAEEIELWMAKKNLSEKKEKKKKMWKTLFPWVPPLTSLLLPNKHTPADNNNPSPRMQRRGLGSEVRKRHSNFNDGSSSPRMLRGFMTTPNSGRNLLVTLNIVAFIYQLVTAVWYLPGFNRVLAASVAGDAYSAAAINGGLSAIPQWTPTEVLLRALGLVGGGAGVVIASGSSMRGAAGRVIGRGPIAAHSMGPFFLDYAHQPYPLSHFQKHRYLSSGFLHGSLLHLGMNLRALVSLPSWLENGIGKGVYLSAYLAAIVTGNIAHTMSNISGRAASALCIGASGGICGLYGLMLASMMKMGNADAAWYVMKQMVWLLAFGFLVPNVSNAGHIGGFIGGWLIGYLFGPGYERSYTLERAQGLSRDSADWEFRRMMGPGIYPYPEAAIFPLKYLWMGIGVAMLAKPDLRLIPVSLLRGVLEPGALSGARALLR